MLHALQQDFFGLVQTEILKETVDFVKTSGMNLTSPYGVINSNLKNLVLLIKSRIKLQFSRKTILETSDKAIDEIRI